MKELWNDNVHDGLIDLNQMTTNDISAVLRTYGVEAARAAIVKEVAGVFGVYGISVDPRHLGLIADYMVCFFCCVTIDTYSFNFRLLKVDTKHSIALE